MVYLRFECGQEDRTSPEYGPFPFVQLTYDEVRVGPDGDSFASFSTEGEWRTLQDPDWYSDVMIYDKST